MNKYFYVVDYWVKFPVSEYGGLINLIAQNDMEAFEILSNEDSFEDCYSHLIMEKVINAQKFQLTDEYESGIIQVFCT
jgi:hypothetical protein